MKNYELALIVRSTLSQDQSSEVVQQIKNILNENKGDVFREESWGIQKFAYPIKKLNSGYYFLLNFSLSVEGISKLKKGLETNEQILRHLLITTLDRPTEPSIRTKKEN